jgi:hypothetical protein
MYVSTELHHQNQITKNWSTESAIKDNKCRIIMRTTRSPQMWSKSAASTKGSPHANRPKPSAERHIWTNIATEGTCQHYLTQVLQISDTRANTVECSIRKYRTRRDNKTLFVRINVYIEILLCANHNGRAIWGMDVWPRFVSVCVGFCA